MTSEALIRDTARNLGRASADSLAMVMNTHPRLGDAEREEIIARIQAMMREDLRAECEQAGISRVESILEELTLAAFAQRFAEISRQGGHA